MISVVNGYVCTSSCDVTKAKQNKDPNAPPGVSAGADDSAKTAHDPAFILGGALKDSVSVDAVTPSKASAPKPMVDRLI